ncbi:hypothetical protein FA95DRAFT_125498 [Auriscalpium vulgare]|uniref:Uncharacterized protein n=1 Tax=Auriscalpium vulgare TaxID=40419 RepID=A0ACB8RNC8_9AGAM|nr:hypothetical protein FA95DRAFT_125498 [Auriscalpium vulgare]
MPFSRRPRAHSIPSSVLHFVSTLTPRPKRPPSLARRIHAHIHARSKPDKSTSPPRAHAQPANAKCTADALKSHATRAQIKSIFLCLRGYNARARRNRRRLDSLRTSCVDGESSPLRTHAISPCLRRLQPSGRAVPCRRRSRSARVCGWRWHNAAPWQGSSTARPENRENVGRSSIKRHPQQRVLDSKRSVHLLALQFIP